jgi:hypothetical protein
MTDTHPAVNCPRCRQPLNYRQTGVGTRQKGKTRYDNEEVHLYFCERDGFYNLWPDGRLRYVASSHRPTERSDFE